MSLLTLSNQIQNVDHHLKSQVGKAVNKFLTMRNWMIGYYIVEYEQEGEERAQYGARLIDSLAESINQQGLSGRNLKQFKQFYLTYSHIGPAVSRQLQKVIVQTPSAQLEGEIVQTPSAQLRMPDYERINKLITIKNPYPEIKTPAEKLLHHISFSKFVELMRIQNPLKRTFYEIECIKGNWSVKELQRQIHSLFYERIGMSKDPGKLKEMVEGKTEKQTPKDIIKNIYTFEFLGFPVKDVVEEQDLEQALLDHLQEFILELGRGFCFEARQKRILIGEDNFFVDLVFYHRILRCHVLIDLKIGKFSHADAGQLNTYLAYYKNQVMDEFDRDPVGILMVTDKNNTLVEYATAGMDENMFVQTYMLELPTEDQLRAVILEELERL